MNNIQQIRREMVKVCQRLYDRNLVGGTEGNVSVRLKRREILITPSGKCLGFLKPSEITVISSEGKKLSGALAPSSEYRMHVGIYSHRPDINAICHAHPIYATAFAVAGIALNKKILPEIVNSVGIIPLVDYAAPGTMELFNKMRKTIANHDACLLKNHGLVTLGVNLEDAFNKLEMIERFAQVLHAVKTLGKPSLLSLKALKELESMAKTQNQNIERKLRIKKRT